MPDLKKIEQFLGHIHSQKVLVSKHRSQSLVSLVSLLNHLSGNAYDDTAYQGFLFKRKQGELLKLLLEGYLRLCQSAPLLPKPLEKTLPVIEKKDDLSLKTMILDVSPRKKGLIQNTGSDKKKIDPFDNKENVDPNPLSPIKKIPFGLSLQNTSPQKVIKNFSISELLISNFDEDDSFVIDEHQEVPEILSYKDEKVQLVSFLFDQLSHKNLMSPHDFKKAFKEQLSFTDFSLKEEAYKVYKALFDAKYPKEIVKTDVLQNKKTSEDSMDQIVVKAKDYINFIKRDGTAVDDNSIAIVVRGFLKPNCTTDVESLKFKNGNTPLSPYIDLFGEDVRAILEKQIDPKAKDMIPHLDATIKVFQDQLERIRVESLTIEALTYTVDVKRDEKKSTEIKPLQMGGGIPSLPPNLLPKGGIPLLPPSLGLMNKPKTTMVEIVQLNLNSLPILKKNKGRGYLLAIDKNFFADEYLKLCQENGIKDIDAEEKKTLYKYFALGDKEIDYFTNLFEPFLYHMSKTLDGLSIFSKSDEKDIFHLKSLLKRMDILSFCDHIRMTLLKFVQSQRPKDKIKYTLSQERLLQIEEKVVLGFQNKIDNVFLLREFPDFPVESNLRKEEPVRRIKHLLSLAQVELQDKK